MTLTSRLLSTFASQRAITPNQVFGADLWDYYTNGTSGERVDAKTAMTLSAVWSAVRLLSQDVATLPFHSIEADGLDRRPAEQQPDWLSTPQVSDPNFTIVDYLSQVCVSLLIDGNAFVLALPSVARPFELTVLNPQRVTIKRDGGRVIYERQDDKGAPAGTLLGDQLLHIPWVRRPGELRGLSPVQVQEETIGRGLAAQEVSARFFRQGSLYGGFVEVPRDTDMTSADVKKMLEDIARRHQGHRKSWLLGALTGGATFKQAMVNPNDSQTLETEKWIREQIGAAYGIPPFLMGSTIPGAVSYNSSEQQGILYKQSAIRPISTRIERAHSRLLPPGQQMKFNLEGLLRADFKTRTEGYRTLWNVGALSPDEIRSKEDLPPLPDGIGKTYWVPLNMAPAEQVISLPLPTDPAGPRTDPNQQQEQPANGQ